MLLLEHLWWQEPHAESNLRKCFKKKICAWKHLEGQGYRHNCHFREETRQFASHIYRLRRQVLRVVWFCTGTDWPLNQIYFEVIHMIREMGCSAVRQDRGVGHIIIIITRIIHPSVHPSVHPIHPTVVVSPSSQVDAAQFDHVNALTHVTALSLNGAVLSTVCGTCTKFSFCTGTST